MVCWRSSEIPQIELAAAVRHAPSAVRSSNRVLRLVRALFLQDERVEWSGQSIRRGFPFPKFACIPTTG